MNLISFDDRDIPLTHKENSEGKETARFYNFLQAKMPKNCYKQFIW